MKMNWIELKQKGNIEELPIGVPLLVKLDSTAKPYGYCEVHSPSGRPLAVINNVFHWDMPPITHYVIVDD